MSDDWISIWELAEELWPDKPRYFASRLLNYSILQDLPRKVGDVMGVIGGDVERLYNISVNSPNVDKLAREVFLSSAVIRSHIESKRFNPEERYLPRRPRQEEYLVSRSTPEVKLLQVGDASSSSAELTRLSYFGRLNIPYAVTRKKGIPVALDYRNNLIVDKDAPAIREQARRRYSDEAVLLPEGAEAPSRLGSINSEEAMLWNVFRTLMRENGLKYFCATPTLWPPSKVVFPDERVSAAWFWGMNDRGGSFQPLLQAAEQIGDPLERAIVPSIILLGINQFLMVDCRYGSTFPSCPMLKQETCPGTKECSWWKSKAGIPAGLPGFIDRNDIPRTCGRHFHLMRLTLLMKVLSSNPTLGAGRLVVLIDENQEAGSLNRKLFLDFVKHLPAEEQGRFAMTSWQRLRTQLPYDSRYEELHREFKEKLGI